MHGASLHTLRSPPLKSHAIATEWPARLLTQSRTRRINMAPEKRTSSGRRDTLLDEDDDVDAISPKRMRTNARDSTANDTTPRRSYVRGSRDPSTRRNASDSDGVVTPDEDEADAQQEQRRAR